MSPQTPPTDRPLTAGDWITHDGGPNPVPGQMVEYKMAGHLDEGSYGPDRSDEVVWRHDAEDHDIIAYRLARPATSAASEGEVMGLGWLRKAVLHLLPRWGMEGHEVPLPGVRGVPNADHTDPRFSIHCYSGHGGNLTVALMVGRDHSQGGRWQEMDFTPEQAVQIAAAILSMPAVEHVAAPLVAALASPPVSERERELEGEDHEAIERSLRTIRAYDAVRLLQAALLDTMKRQHTGYDWNADPDQMTLKQGDALASATKVFADLNAAVDAIPEPTEEEREAALTAQPQEPV